MVIDPSGRILANARSRNGKLICEVEDIHWKYQRSDSFGGTMINNDWFIEKGRTPWSYRPAGSSVRPDDRRMPYPRVCAHRGFCQIAPENTLPAFGAAIALGADEIELDLRQTADGVPVVIHDSVLERVSNGTGDISAKTLAELKELDFGSKSGAAFAGLKIATFEEVLKRFPRQTVFNVHIKSPDSVGYLQKIVQLIRDYDCLDHVYVAGGGDVMEAMREVAPSIPRCLIIGHNPERIDVVSIAVRYGCAKIQFMKPWLDREMIEKVHANDIRCNLFWCDDPTEAAEYLALGVDTILTNNYWQIARIVHPGIGG